MIERHRFRFSIEIDGIELAGFQSAKAPHDVVLISAHESRLPITVSGMLPSTPLLLLDRTKARDPFHDLLLEPLTLKIVPPFRPRPIAIRDRTGRPRTIDLHPDAELVFRLLKIPPPIIFAPTLE